MVSIEHRIYSCLLTVFRHLFSIVSPLKASSMIVKTDGSFAALFYCGRGRLSMLADQGGNSCPGAFSSFRTSPNTTQVLSIQWLRPQFYYYAIHIVGPSFDYQYSKIASIFIIFPSYKLPECACIFAATKLKVVCLKLQYPDHVRAGG